MKKKFDYSALKSVIDEYVGDVKNYPTRVSAINYIIEQYLKRYQNAKPVSYAQVISCLKLNGKLDQVPRASWGGKSTGRKSINIDTAALNKAFKHVCGSNTSTPENQAKAARAIALKYSNMTNTTVSPQLIIKHLKVMKLQLPHGRRGRPRKASV